MTKRSQAITRLLAFAVAVATSIIGLALAPAAFAVYLGCGPTELTFVQYEGCTRTGIVKADGALLTREQLLDNRAFYAAEGFDEVFIREAPLFQFTVDETTTWSGCDNNGDDGLCQPSQGEHLFSTRMADLFPVGTVVTAIGGPSKWIALMCGNFHPVAIPGADSAKVSFTIIDPPSRIDADTDVPITVHATVVNNGPASTTDVIDVIEASGPPDCTITPSSLSVPFTLVVGSPVSFDSSFVVRCSEPSNHVIHFVDHLRSEVGRYDPNPDNNSMTVDLATEVFDDSDIAVTSPALECTDQTEVGVPFECTGSAVVTNLGPYGPTETTSTLSLSGLEDCTITPTSGSALTDTLLAVGAATPVTQTWSVSCSVRSFHPFTVTASATASHLHVEDHNPANDQASAHAMTEVFQDVDLEATLDHLACSEREANRTDSGCVATMTVTNNGPADCLITPSPTQTTTRTLATGESWTFTTSVHIACATDRRHVVRVQATVHNAPSDPHAVDSDTVTGIWVPSDIKPRSYPSSINLGKEGILPFALLGTAEFNPLTDVDRTTLAIGRTGTETGEVRCATEGEDVNGDGYLDLICQVETATAAIRCDSTHLEIVGTLTDGTPLWSQDEIKVTGCRR
jgi:hypothetical protein